MTKKQRMMELVHLVLRQQQVIDEDWLTVCDCFVAMPDRCIPDTLSLRHFVHDALDYFFGRDGRCEMSYARAAKYIKKWRETWVPRHEERYGGVPAGHTAVFWTVDTNLLIEEVKGGALSVINLAPEDFVGKTMSEFWGSCSEAHPVVGPCAKALRGEVVTQSVDFAGHRWNYTVTPRVEDGRITGAHATAVLLDPAGPTLPRQLDVVVSEEEEGVVVIRTDRRLRVVSALGDVLKPKPDAHVGANLADYYAPSEMHILDQIQRSLGGECISRRVYFRGRQWQVMTAPRAEAHGVLLTAVLLAGHEDASLSGVDLAVPGLDRMGAADPPEAD